MGEFRHAIAEGLIGPTSIGAIGSLAEGRAPARSGDGTTIFDSSCIALQDPTLCAPRWNARAAGLAHDADFG